jgi:hypothetical protein
MPAARALPLRRWLRAPLFRSYLRTFVVLWVAVKYANAFVAAYVRLPPLAFRPGTEIVACAIELLVLAAFIRRAHEDILLANLGCPLWEALVPLVPLHFALSFALAMVG